MPAKLNIIGESFGYWRVVGEPVVQKKSRRTVICHCRCGTIKEVIVCSLLKTGNGASRSCGCLKMEKTAKRLTTHGKTSTPEYRIWSGMIQRTSNPDSAAFPNYGGRGICVCEQWRDFANFYKDIGPRPSKKHTLDRIDNNRGYSPENTRWATRTCQNNNKRSNRNIHWLGKNWTVAELAVFLRVKFHNLQHAINTAPGIEMAIYLLVARGYIPNLFGRPSPRFSRTPLRGLKNAKVVSE